MTTRYASPCKSSSVHRQNGQALVLAMVVLSAALIAFVRYFQTGQVVGAKARQTHALDAAAYSGALVQARALNMLSYINRAQVGHHVAMAHLVTLGSWASFAGTQAQQLARGNPPAHLITMMFGPAHGQAYLAAARATGLGSLAREHGALATAYARHDQRVRLIFTQVQSQLVESLPTAREKTMLAVLNQNFGTDDRFHLSIQDDQWPGFVQYYSSRSLRSFVHDVSSLYQFLAPRDHTARNNWVVDARCPHKRHELRRRGSTVMDADGRWQSIDTESFHALRSNRWIGCYFREYSMGWGWIPSAKGQTIADPHVHSPPDDFSAQDFWRWVQESTDWNIASGTANPLASSRAAADRQRWEGGGLQPYIDISRHSAPHAGFSAMLQRSGPEGLTVTTRSAAETFFQRPVSRSDGKTEAPNLFRPYWQARLSAALSSSGSSGGAR